MLGDLFNGLQWAERRPARCRVACIVWRSACLEAERLGHAREVHRFANVMDEPIIYFGPWKRVVQAQGSQLRHSTSALMEIVERGGATSPVAEGAPQVASLALLPVNCEAPGSSTGQDEIALDPVHVVQRWSRCGCNRRRPMGMFTVTTTELGCILPVLKTRCAIVLSRGVYDDHLCIYCVQSSQYQKRETKGGWGRRCRLKYGAPVWRLQITFVKNNAIYVEIEFSW